MTSTTAQIVSVLGKDRVSSLSRGFIAFGSAELASRVFRLASTIVIARQLAPEIVGQAALSLTLFELIRVLARTGVGQHIIACPESELAATCNTARLVFWIWSAVLVAVQLAIAMIVGLVFNEPLAAMMLAALALVYLLMPGGLVQCHLALREDKTPQMARTNALQAITDQILTAMLLLIWPSPWSVVLPKILTAPLWLVRTRAIRPWAPDPSLGFAPWRPLAGFSTKVLAAEAMGAMRTQGDNLIIVAFFGTNVLGAYYFAYNAGVGIVTSLVGAFTTVAFPLICREKTDADRAHALKLLVVAGGVIFLPLIALQAITAPFYVPLVFGQHWAFAAPLVSVLCLAGIPLLASAIISSWLRAKGKAGVDASASTAICVATLSGCAIGAASGSIMLAAIGLVSAQTVVAGTLAWTTLSKPLRSHSFRPSKQEKIA